MNHVAIKSKSTSLIGRPSYYSLVRRVARKLGLSEAYISKVKSGNYLPPRTQRGRETVRQIVSAIEAERRLMDREAVRG